MLDGQVDEVSELEILANESRAQTLLDHHVVLVARLNKLLRIPCRDVESQHTFVFRILLAPIIAHLVQ